MNNFLSIVGVEQGLCQSGFDFGFYISGIEVEFGVYFFLSFLWNKEVWQVNVQYGYWFMMGYQYFVYVVVCVVYNGVFFYGDQCFMVGGYFQN